MADRTSDAPRAPRRSSPPGFPAGAVERIDAALASIERFIDAEFSAARALFEGGFEPPSMAARREADALFRALLQQA